MSDRPVGKLPTVPRKGARMAQEPTSQLGASLMAALDICRAQKAQGVPLADRLAGLEKTLRAAWPSGRLWKYLCPDCGDLGLVMAECAGDARCGRQKPHPAHSYGTPCVCSLGVRFRPRSVRDNPAAYMDAGVSVSPYGLPERRKTQRRLRQW